MPPARLWRAGAGQAAPPGPVRFGSSVVENHPFLSCWIFLSVWFLWIFHYLEISRKLSKIFEFQILEILTIPILKTNDFFRPFSTNFSGKVTPYSDSSSNFGLGGIFAKTCQIGRGKQSTFGDFLALCGWLSTFSHFDPQSSRHLVALQILSILHNYA